jgi:hypothetical protein
MAGRTSAALLPVRGECVSSLPFGSRQKKRVGGEGNERRL